MSENYWIDPEPPGLVEGDWKSREELRKFGFVMAGALAVLGGYFLWRGRGLAPYLLGAGGFFLVAGLLAPRFLSPVERAWMAFAEILGAVVTRVILALTFYLVITPVGLFIRLSSGETLGKRADPEAATYWIPVEPDGPTSRPDKPF